MKLLSITHAINSDAASVTVGVALLTIVPMKCNRPSHKPTIFKGRKFLMGTGTYPFVAKPATGAVHCFGFVAKRIGLVVFVKVPV